MPPASAVANPGSCGHTLCSTQTLAVYGELTSLPSLLPLVRGDGNAPRCECTSIRPGVTQRPLASMMRVPASAGSVWPTALILPSTISRSALSRRAPAPSRMVALRISVGGLAATRYVEGYGSALGAALAATVNAKPASVAANTVRFIETPYFLQVIRGP